MKVGIRIRIPNLPVRLRIDIIITTIIMHSSSIHPSIKYYQLLVLVGRTWYIVSSSFMHLDTYVRRAVRYIQSTDHDVKPATTITSSPTANTEGGVGIVYRVYLYVQSYNVHTSESL